MRDLWGRIERRLADAAPQLLADLRPPVPDADLQGLRHSAGTSLPDEMVGSFQVHDGQFGRATQLFGSYQLYPLGHATRVLGILRSRTCSPYENGESLMQRIPSIRWSEDWIPIAGNGIGQYYCVDQNPGKLGMPGQIIRVDSAGPMREWIATGMRAWLEDFTARLEDGRVVFDPRWGLTDAGTRDGRFCADWGIRE